LRPSPALGHDDGVPAARPRRGETYRSTIYSFGRADYQVLAGFRRALRRFLRFSEEAAAAEGLTPRQHQALLAVRGAAAGRLTVGQLAGHLQIRHHSAVGLVDRLAALGLVRRRRASGDRRRVAVGLTPVGTRRLARLSAVHRMELAELVPALKSLIRALRPRPSARRGAAPGASRAGARPRS
jgi:DNA-binding MarR family transcriptional regulator